MLLDNAKRIILLILFLIIFILMIIYISLTNDTHYVYTSKLNFYKIPDLKNQLEKDSDIDLDIKINGNRLYYNNKEDVYYYYLDSSYQNKFYHLNIDMKANKRYKYIVNDDRYIEKQGYYINFEYPISLFLYNDKSYKEIKVQFTCLPIMNINLNDISIDDITIEDSDAVIEIYDKDYKNEEKISYTESKTKIKTRGALSSLYPKKQYRLKLYKEKDQSIVKNRISLLDMEEDEDWILDGLYSDYSKVRSKLCFDLWNEINSDSVDNDIDSDYVILYINEEYVGVYILREVVDRKLLNLDKRTDDDSGILIKGYTYTDLQYDEVSKKTNIVSPFEMKYPSDVEDYSIYWNSLLYKIHGEYFEEENRTFEYIDNNFILNNYVDYKILINVIMAQDNFGTKNLYLSVNNMNKDEKVLITPWDLDMTFGYSYGGSEPTYIYEYFDSAYALPTNIINNPKEIYSLIKKRYFELRKTTLDINNVYSVIDSYYNRIKYSFKKDSDKWLDASLDDEIIKIKNWYRNRIEFLDENI